MTKFPCLIDPEENSCYDRLCIGLFTFNTYVIYLGDLVNHAIESSSDLIGHLNFH